MLKRIELSDDQKEFIDGLVRDIDAARTLAKTAGRIENTSNSLLWDVLKKMFPKLKEKIECRDVMVNFEHPKNGPWVIQYFEDDYKTSDTSCYLNKSENDTSA